jgi:hypothetical protein
MTATDSANKISMYPALRVLERNTPPLKYGRPPYWRAPVCPASEQFYCPVWNWVSPQEFPPGHEVTVLDVNAAYLSAMGGVTIAHSHLEHTGSIGAHFHETLKVRPGYYRITIPYWPWSGTIVHPLGDSSRLETETTVWVAAPTLILLLELEAEGHLNGLEILDSWTANVTTNFRKWADRLRSVREELIDAIDMAQTETYRAEQLDAYNAFKQGYSAALSMMLTGEKCATHRPDWAHTIYAQHAASTWRKAWRFTYTGRHLVAMGAVDEIAILTEDIPAAVALPKPPFRLDASGRTPGALKPKTRMITGEDAPQRAETIATVDEDPEDYV